MPKSHKAATQQLNEQHKAKQKLLKIELRRLEKEVPVAEYDLKALTNRARLTLIIEDADMVSSKKSTSTTPPTTPPPHC